MGVVGTKQDSHLTVGNAIEIVGKVNQDLSVKVLKATDMGTGFGKYILSQHTSLAGGGFMTRARIVSILRSPWNFH